MQTIPYPAQLAPNDSVLFEDNFGQIIEGFVTRPCLDLTGQIHIVTPEGDNGVVYGWQAILLEVNRFEVEH